MGRKPPKYFCGRCEGSFTSKQALNVHLQDHEDAEPARLKCPVCPFDFEDSLALENHRLQNNHWAADEFKCDRCTEVFATERGYNRHRQHGQPCCDAFHSKDWHKRPLKGYIDPDKPYLVSKQVQTLEYGDNISTGTPSNLSASQEYCHYCNKAFPSEFAYDHHLLRCTALNAKLTPDSPPETASLPYQAENTASQSNGPVSSKTAPHHTVTVQVPSPHAVQMTTLDDAPTSLPLQSMTLKIKAPENRNPPLIQEPGVSVTARVLASAPTPSAPQAPSVQPTGTGLFVCKIKECQRSYNSEQGLKMHQSDAHNVGGKGLDLYGKDSWMLGQRERERLKAEGLLRAPTNALRGGKNSHGDSRRERAVPMPPAQRFPVIDGPYRQASSHANVTAKPPPLPTSQNIGGPLEMEQAKFVCGKTLRLLLQTDVFIHHDGKMNVSGIDWTRIGVERQPEVVGMFDKMVHLPRSLQSFEYVPAPKTFLSEYNAHYPVAEFKTAPDRHPAKPGLGIIAIACSKVTLNNGCHEVVKIAAIDVLTCRVLMSHLVCTDPSAQVVNWHSTVTGVASFKDLEDARQAGYKVLRGRTAARSALFKFIDKDTIIVGHNLRSELDPLRIIHGRAVDIAKVVEKAAQGPLSKIQVSLDSWCRDVANVARLKTDPVFGRDCVMTAFAVREIGLWSIKNKEKFEKVAKQKTQEYQFVTKT